MALLALVVSAAGFLVSVMTYVHSRRRDFPRSRLRVVKDHEDQMIHLRVASVGAGIATRIESWVWDSVNKTWRNQGPWAVPMPPGEQLSAGRFEPGGHYNRLRVTWYDEMRPDKRRSTTSRW